MAYRVTRVQTIGDTKCSLSIKAASAAIFIALITPAFAAPEYLAVGARATTWRAGDAVWYSGGCHAVETLVQIARNPASEVLFMVNVERGLCFVLEDQQSSILVKWIDGPYQDNIDDFTGSIWEFFHDGHRAFLWLSDKSGPHKRIRAKDA